MTSSSAVQIPGSLCWPNCLLKALYRPRFEFSVDDTKSKPCYLSEEPNKGFKEQRGEYLLIGRPIWSQLSSHFVHERCRSCSSIVIIFVDFVVHWIGVSGWVNLMNRNKAKIYELISQIIQFPFECLWVNSCIEASRMIKSDGQGIWIEWLSKWTKDWHLNLRCAITSSEIF